MFISKTRCGRGGGFLVAEEYTQLAVDLEKAGGKSPVFMKHLVQWQLLATISFLPFSVVGQGDVRLLHQTEVADPHPPTERLCKAEDGPVLILGGLLNLQLPDVTWEGRLGINIDR